MLPESLKERAMREARERGVSFGEFIRESLSAMLAQTRGTDSLLADKAVFQGKAPSDLSSDHDRYLYGDEE